jgi:hypothetical protein
MPEILCPTCRHGRLTGRRVFRLDLPAVVAGFMLLAAGGLAFFAGAALFGIADMNRTPVGTLPVALAASSIPLAVAGVLMTGRRSVLYCDYCRAITPAD